MRFEKKYKGPETGGAPNLAPCGSAIYNKLRDPCDEVSWNAGFCETENGGYVSVKEALKTSI